jgi:hypothetical protein
LRSRNCKNIAKAQTHKTNFQQKQQCSGRKARAAGGAHGTENLQMPFCFRNHSNFAGNIRYLPQRNPTKAHCPNKREETLNAMHSV